MLIPSVLSKTMSSSDCPKSTLFPPIPVALNVGSCSSQGHLPLCEVYRKVHLLPTRLMKSSANGFPSLPCHIGVPGTPCSTHSPDSKLETGDKIASAIGIIPSGVAATITLITYCLPVAGYLPGPLQGWCGCPRREPYTACLCVSFGSTPMVSNQFSRF